MTTQLRSLQHWLLRFILSWLHPCKYRIALHIQFYGGAYEGYPVRSQTMDLDVWKPEMATCAIQPSGAMSFGRSNQPRSWSGQAQLSSESKPTRSTEMSAELQTATGSAESQGVTLAVGHSTPQCNACTLEKLDWWSGFEGIEPLGLPTQDMPLGRSCHPRKCYISETTWTLWTLGKY